MTRALLTLCTLAGALSACEIDNPNYSPFDLYTAPDLRGVVQDLAGTATMNFAGYGSFVAPGACTGTLTTGVAYDAYDSTKPPCTACRCDTPAACATRLQAFPNNFCAVGPAMVVSLAQGCVNLSLNSVTYPGFTVETPQAPCNPAQAQVTPDVQVRRRGQLCLAPGKVRTCTNVACVLQQADGGNLCVAFADATACPAPFSNRVRWSSTYTDNRTCTCTCDSTGTCSGGTVTVSGKPDCPTGADSSAVPFNSCTLFSNLLMDPAKSVRFTNVTAVGPCAPKGQVSAGSPSLSGNLTLCCTDPL